MTFMIRELDHRNSKKWAAPLAEVSAKLWADTFTGISYYTPEIVKGYTDEAFTNGTLECELSDPNNIFQLVEYEQTIVGYAKMEIRQPEAVIQTKNPLYLSRFYLDRSVHGIGLAKKLLDSVNGGAESRGFLSLWLSVLELNVPAVKFYTKHGFTKVGEWEYPYMSHGKRYIDIDWLMVRPIK